jgi:asparagine synthase (glutamine-hydrolysing)
MSRVGGFLTRAPGSAQVSKRLLRFSVPGEAPQVLDTAVGTVGWAGTDGGGVAADGSLSLCLDGVIFNRDERAHFGGNADSDATLLLRLTARHGLAAALGKVNGDFAVAVIDADRGTLQLARDRVGAKPLYYAATPRGVAFASRCGALLSIEGVSAEPNRRFAAVFAGGHYRSIDNDPNESPYKDVAQVPAATVVTLALGQPAKFEPYWRLQPATLASTDEAALAEQYRALLLDAVALRVGRSLRPAFTLSGGLDSSSVLSCAVEKMGTKPDAFSTVYSDSTYDESSEIQSMLDSKVGKWHPVLVETPPVVDLVRRMVLMHDEPVATATWLSHLILVEDVAANGFGTLFGGLGGDELNAGEFEYFIFHFADLKATGQDPLLAHEITEWQRHHDHPIYRKGPAEAQQAISRLTDPAIPGGVRVDTTRMRRYYPAVARDWYDLDRFTHVLDHPFSSFLLNRTFQDIFRETAPCCLRAEDRHTAAFGLQRYDPFFDHRLMEFMFAVPGRYKIRNGVTKRLLRAAMTGILPEETRTRVKKTGWNAPAHRWFGEGRNLDDLRDLIASRAFRERGLYDPAVVTKLLDEHIDIVQSGKTAENHMMFFWQLVNAETWLDQISRIARIASQAA